MVLNQLPTDTVSPQPAELCVALQVHDSFGLTEEEVQERRAHFGLNKLPAKPHVSFWCLALRQFDDLLVRILLVAALISFSIAIFERNFLDLAEPFIILLILVSNAIVSVWQEDRAEGAIEALKDFVPSRAVVVRDGATHTVCAEDLVPGDVVEITVGNRIPADIRLLQLESTTLRVDESILNGESDEVMKHAEGICGRHERFAPNMVYSGTNVVYGKARGVVVRTGTSTEIGLIEKYVREQEEVKTPLQIKLDEFGVLLSKLIGYICLLVFGVNLIHWYSTHIPSADEDWCKRYVRPFLHCLKVAVALAVAAIPEGLPAVVTTCLALGTRRMARSNAIVRDLPSVETLGRCTVICSDKTGTLTTNHMSVVRVLTPGSGPEELNLYTLEDSQINVVTGSVMLKGQRVNDVPSQDAALDMLTTVAVLCNEASLYRNPHGVMERIGESTEAALLVMSEKLALAEGSVDGGHASFNAYRLQKQKQWRKEAILEFTRERKSMSALCTSTTDPKMQNLFVKGAPEEILQRSSRVMWSDGRVTELNGPTRSALAERVDTLSSSENALRCLGFAFRRVSRIKPAELAEPTNFEAIESDLTFVGVCGMLDPPRPEVRDAIAKCRSASIRVVVVTGDKKETAEAICRKVGLFEGVVTPSESFTGREFDKMSPAQKCEAAQTVVLFSRTDPSHKMQLVKLLQEQRLICAMTGDGVNDAPALKRADIGIAMGSGTEVAQAASKMVLADNNFATVVKAVREGRAIFNNAKQFIRYLISSNIGEVACVMATGLLGLPEALSPIQLLWVNLVTDGLPATALGFNAPDPDIMLQPPRKINEPVVNGWLFFRYMVIGIYVGLATVTGFLWWFLTNGFTWVDLTSFTRCTDMTSDKCVTLANPDAARAIALSILVVIEMLNALNALSENQSLLICRPSTNIWLLLAIASSIILHLIIMYVPFFAQLFSIMPLGVEPSLVRAAQPWSVLIPTSFIEWKVVLVLSIPIVFIDEALKFLSRRLTHAKPALDEDKKWN